jgi:predicted nucleic acid-binding protein
VIILDTNVVSELVRQHPVPHVLAWLDGYRPDEVYLTSVSVAELLYGVVRLPECHRAAIIAARLGEIIDADFRERVLAFTGDAALWYAEIVVARERQGRPIGTADAQIAAICRAHDGELATRNVKDFTDTGVRIVDPWA